MSPNILAPLLKVEVLSKLIPQKKMKSLADLELSYMATSLTVASKKSGIFFEVFWVVFGFCCNPLGLWVSDPSPRVEDGWGGR